MSYLVLPSAQKEYNIKGNTIQGATTLTNPASYTNYFSNPIIVPPKSKVALLSTKINRIDAFDVSSNNGYYLFVGNELPISNESRMLESRNYTPIPQSLTAKHRASLSTPESIIYETNMNTQTQTPIQFLETLNINQQTIPHPEFRLQCSAGLEMATTGTSSSRGFNGYKFFYDQASINGSALSASVNNASFYSAHPDTFITPGSGSLTASLTTNASGWSIVTRSASTSDDFNCVVVCPENPLSLSGGACTFHIGATGGDGGFQVGLTRPKQIYNEDNSLTTRTRRLGQNPDYFNSQDDQYLFYDYAVRVDEETKLTEVYQSVIKNGEFQIEEVDYYNASNGSNSDFAGAQLIWLPNEKSDIRFTAIGERMLIEIYNTKTVAWQTLADCSNTFHGVSMTTKPINQNMWYMFPIMDLSIENTSLALSGYQGRQTYDGETSLPKVAEQYSGFSFYGSCQKGKILGSFGKEAVKNLDFRDQNNVISPYTVNSSLIGLNASGGVAYSAGLILEGSPVQTSQNQRYLDIRENPFAKVFSAQSSDYLGFSPMSEIVRSRNTQNNHENSASQSSYHFSSTSPPKPYSRSNTYIRIKDLPITTYNGGNSGISKIIGTVPRFDSSNEEVGALFHDVGNPIYINLNNSEELRLNQISIDFVNINETIVQDLTGTSVITLHII